MPYSTYDFSAEQGSDLATTITYKDDSGNPINLSGYTSRMQIRQFVGSVTPWITLTNGHGITITANAGVIDVLVTANALSAIPAGSYVYDLEIVDGYDQVAKLLSGKFEVAAEVTR